MQIITHRNGKRELIIDEENSAVSDDKLLREISLTMKQYHQLKKDLGKAIEEKNFVAADEYLENYYNQYRHIHEYQNNVIPLIRFFLDKLNDDGLTNTEQWIDFLNEYTEIKNVVLCFYMHNQMDKVNELVTQHIIILDVEHYDGFYEIFKKHIPKNDDDYFTSKSIIEKGEYDKKIKLLKMIETSNLAQNLNNKLARSEIKSNQKKKI